MPKRSNKINKGTNAGSNLSERLMKLSDSKSYMFLGRRNSDSSTPGTKITKGNSSSNNSRHGNTNNNNSKNTHNKSDNTIHTSTTKTSLYRDDYLFFEIYQEQQQEGEQEEGGDEQKAEAGAGDDIPNYTIMYHNWTLRQLYRHVVSSIKVAKDSNSNTNTNTNVNTTTRTSNIGTTTVNNNDNINKPSAIHRRSRSASVGSSNSAIFPPPPPPLPSITNDNNSKPHHRRQVSTSSATNGRRHGHHHHHHNENHHISRPLEPKLLGSNLHPRDMRRLVTPFSASNEPELIVRRHVIVFNFDPLRAIITRDRLLVLVPSGADSILKNLEERIVGNNMEEIECYYDDDEDDDNDDIENDLITNNNTSKRQYVDEESVIEKAGGVKIDDESDLLGNIFNDSDMGEGGDTYDDTTYDDDDDDDWSNIMAMDDMDQQTDLTFELLCVNACLATVFEMLADDTEELEEKGLKYVQNRIIGGNNNNNSNNNSNSRGFFGRIMNNSQNNNIVRPEDALAVIRNLKNATKVMQARVKGFVQSLTRILNEDEDMALMNVSRLISHPQNFIQPVSIAQLEIESDEPELVLESNLHNALTLSNALDLIQGQVDTARYARTYDF